MNATTTSTLSVLKPAAVAKRLPVTAKQSMLISALSSSATAQRLSLLKPSVGQSFSLNPVARLLEQAAVTSNLEQLKHLENKLVALSLMESTFPLLWQALANGSVQQQSVAMMALLRAGNRARTWVAHQLQQPSDASSVVIEPWVLDFLIHQLSL